MIVVADFYRIGNEHVPVNACLLSIIASEYKNDIVDFYAEEEHTTAIKKFWTSNKISVPNISFHTHRSGSSEVGGIRMVLSRISAEFILLRRLSQAVKNKSDSIVFFLSLSSVNAIVQKRFLFKNVRSIITLHGDVEFIRLNNDFTRNFLGRCFRLAFRLKRKNYQYLVLDQIIKDNLVKSGFLTAEEIIAIPHPYIYKYIVTGVEYKQPFRIGHIGVASNEKQTFLLFKISENCKAEIDSKKLEFLLIGRNENLEENVLNNYVAGARNKKMLSREDFEHAISTLHYTIFFYNDIYQLTGSGAIQDALNFEKPIIALKNELFNAIFERAGNIGFLCDDVEEIEKVLKRIALGEVGKHEYETMQFNLRNHKQSNSPEKIKEWLFSQLNHSVNNGKYNDMHELV